jgi:hypothetical protein
MEARAFLSVRTPLQACFLNLVSSGSVILVSCVTEACDALWRHGVSLALPGRNAFAPDLPSGGKQSNLIQFSADSVELL